MSQAVTARPTPSHHEARAWSHEGASATLRFAVSLALTVGYVAFAVWASAPWRAELRDAIGPVMAWVIPIFLAYVPAVLIGFMVFTLLISRYREPPFEPPLGTWPDGEWPPVTILIAAWNEEGAIVPTLERIADLCVTIAKLTKLVYGVAPDHKLVAAFEEMALRSEEMLKIGLDAFLNRDVPAAEYFGGWRPSAPNLRRPAPAGSPDGGKGRPTSRPGRHWSIVRPPRRSLGDPRTGRGRRS